MTAADPEGPHLTPEEAQAGPIGRSHAKQGGALSPRSLLVSSSRQPGLSCTHVLSGPQSNAPHLAADTAPVPVPERALLLMRKRKQTEGETDEGNMPAGRV